MKSKYNKNQDFGDKIKTVNQLLLDRNICDFDSDDIEFFQKTLEEVNRKNKKRKTIMVMFSGGLDSTYLVWKALSEGHLVQGCYVKLHNNEYQNQLQFECLKRLTNIFKENFPGRFELLDGTEF